MNCRWLSIMALLLLSINVLRGGASKGFADHLFAEGDYQRAIGEYQRMSFFSVDPGSALYIQYKIGECYRRMRDYENAKLCYDNVLLKSTVGGELERRVVVGSAVCLINRNDTEYARIILEDYRTRGSPHDSLSYLIGVSYLKERQWVEADDEFGKIQSRELRASAHALLDDVSSKKLKSPGTALLLSAFIPGAGQIYASKPIKGIISFSLNLSLGYLTYKAYKEDRKMDGFLILYFGFQRFYFGNLQQAREYTAEYNQNINESIKVE